MKDLVSQLDDTESTGKRVATAMRQLAGDAERDFADARDAAPRQAGATQTTRKHLMLTIDTVARHVGRALLELHKAIDATSDPHLSADLDASARHLQHLAERLERIRRDQGVTRWW